MDRGSEQIIRRLDSRIVYRNPWMTVREDRIERPDGSPGIYGVVEKPDFALVIPAENGGFHLVEEYRYPVGRRTWNFRRAAFPAARTAIRNCWPAPNWPRRPGCAPDGWSTWATCTARTAPAARASTSSWPPT